jgi:hypothetical protein
MKKGLQLVSLLALCTLLCGCPPGSRQNTDALKELRANRYDFKKTSKTYAAGIHFLLPDVLVDSSDKTFACHDNSLVKSCYDLGLHFSVDAFDDNEIQSIMEDYDSSGEPLEVIHNHFIETRLQSLGGAAEQSVVSPLKGKRKGLFSTIEETHTYAESNGCYQIATIRHKENCYVFQFICSNELAPYLYDDFQQILQSVY